MRFQTIDELNKFRPKCLCGSQLTIDFSRPHSMIEDCTYMNSALKVISTDNWATLNALIYIDARKSPYGEAECLIKTYVSSGFCSIEDAKFLSNAFSNSTLSPTKFIKTHLTKNIQEKMRMFLVKKCSDKLCKHHYQMETSFLTFDLESGKMNPFVIAFEYFEVGNNIKYSACSRNKIVSIRRSDSKYDSAIQMSASKFQRLRFEEDYLINKIKMLLVFS